MTQEQITEAINMCDTRTIIQENFILTEMKLFRDYCTLIHRARQNAGFASLKYPITDVKLNRYFPPQLREIMADECNIVGYMDVPPIEYLDPFDTLSSCYHKEYENGMSVLISTVRSSWQDDMFKERSERREEALKRKGN